MLGMVRFFSTKEIQKKSDNMLDRSVSKSIREMLATESIRDKSLITWTPTYYKWVTKYSFKESHIKYMAYFIKNFRVNSEKAPFVGFDMTQEQYEYIKSQKPSPRKYVEAKLKEFLDDDF